MSQLSNKIDGLFAEEKWAEARALLKKELAKPGNQSDHWLLTRMSTTYYEEGQYKKALQLVKQAHDRKKNCPLVLWDYAGTLAALGRSEDAIKLYLSLIERGEEEVGREECGEGLEWAIGLLTDCFYRISVCLLHLHRAKAAWQFLVWHLELINAGAATMYTGKPYLRHMLEVLRAHPGESPQPPERSLRSPRTGLKKFRKQAERLLAV